MTTIKACADENQSGELFAVILSELTTPAGIWTGLCDVLQAVVKRQYAFGHMAGEITVRDYQAPGGYAQWTLSLPEAIMSLCDLPADTHITPAEGALGTRPLVWLPPSSTHLEVEDLCDPHGLKDAIVELQRFDSELVDDISGTTYVSLQPYRIPQLPLRSPGGSALSMHIFYDEEVHELSLSAETWLDLWAPNCFDGSANEHWAQINRSWLQELFSDIAQEVDGELDIVG